MRGVLAWRAVLALLCALLLLASTGAINAHAAAAQADDLAAEQPIADSYDAIKQQQQAASAMDAPMSEESPAMLLQSDDAHAQASASNVLEAEVFGSRVFVEQTSAEGGMVEAEEVEALTVDGSHTVPVLRADEAQAQAGAGEPADASLLQHSASSAASASAALGVNAQWAEPTYLPERAEPEAVAPAEPEFIHPLPVVRATAAEPRFMQLGMEAGADSSMRAQELEEATTALKAAQELADSQAKELAALKAAQAASFKLRTQAEAAAAKLVQLRGGNDDEGNIVPPAPLEPVLESAPLAELDGEADAGAEVEIEVEAPEAAETPAPGQLYVDAPGPFATTGFSDDDPIHARAQRLLNKQYTAPALYPQATAAPAASAAASGAPTFRCRSAASHPIQAPVFTASFAPTPAYSCKVSPFVSGLAWQTCHQAHQSCYLSCQSTQKSCDDDFEHCILKACGTGAVSPLCKAVAEGSPAATDPSQTEKNAKVCKEHLVPTLRARFFNTTSYARCQSHACMCVSTPEKERTEPAGLHAIVLPPSALESWPFYTISSSDSLESESASEAESASPADWDPIDTSFLEQGATVLPSKAAALFEQLDARDFVPELDALSAAAGTELLESVADRPDVLAMSSAKQVIGVDYSAAEDAAKGSPHVRAGLVVAKGRRTLEHHIPTCARLAGGRLLGVFESRVGGDASAGLPAHRLLMGVTQQGQARGLVMSSSLLVQLFADRVEVSNAWTPSLQRVNSAALAVVTIQVWASVWEQELFYSLLLATLERVNEAELPVIFRTLEHSTSAHMPPVPALLEAGGPDGAHDSDPYVSAAESLLHAHATRSTGFWIESVSFRFPASVLLVLKSASPATQRLRLEVRSWSEAHAHRNASTMLAVDMSRFEVSTPAAAALAHPAEAADQAGEESFLGSLRIHTQHVEVEMQDTIDSVFILTDRAPLQSAQDEQLSSAERDAILSSADQVFTNLGYFFFFEAGTHAHANSPNGAIAAPHPPRSGWVAGLPEATPTGASVVPELVKPPVLDNGLARPVTSAAPARMVNGPRDPASMSHIVLPGSGVLSVEREPAGARGLVGVARSLTPLSTGVDLSHGYWGVSVLLRLLPSASAASGARTSPLMVQLQLESPVVSDYAFHRSPLVLLSTPDCWTHVQFPFVHFSALSGRPLDLDSISKITLLAQVSSNGAEGEVSRLEVASFTIQTGPLDNQERVVAAPCSHACNAPGAGPMPLDGARMAHQRARIILTGEARAPQMRSFMQARSAPAASLVEMQTQPQRAAAPAAASLSHATVMLAALASWIAWRAV